MGYVLDFAAAEHAYTSASVDDIESITQGLTIKIRFKGEVITQMASWKDACLLSICDGSANYKFRVYFKTDGSSQVCITVGSPPRGNWSSGYVAQGNFDANTWYVLYVHYDDNASPDRCAAVFTDGGTEKIMKTETYNSGNLDTTDGWSKVYVSDDPVAVDGADGQIDGVAIYNAVRTGADRYNAPSASDSGIIHFWPFDEGSGSTTADEVGGGPVLNESATFLWVSGGTWDGGAAPELIEYYRRPNPLLRM